MVVYTNAQVTFKHDVTGLPPVTARRSEMKRSTSVMLTAVAILTAAAAGAANLLTNPNFDTNANGWLLVDNASLKTSHRADTGSTLPDGSGPGSIEVRVFAKGGGWSGTFQIDVPITGGRDYDYAGSVLIPGTANSAQYPVMMVEIYDASNQVIATKAMSQTGLPKDSWQRMSGTVSAPNDGVKARFWMGVQPTQNQEETNPALVYWDDAYLAAAEGGEVVQSLFVPAAAAVHGASSTYWSTDGWFSNLTDATVTIAGAFLYQGQDNSAAVASPTTLGTIPPDGFTKLDDIVTMLGLSEKTGGLYLELTATWSNLPAELTKATTHTYTPNPSGDGVYGQGIPAVPAGTLTTTYVPGVFQGTDMRTNVGALNTSGGTITLDVTILNSAGNEVGSATWTLAAYEQRQVSLPSLGVSSLDGGTVIFERSGHGSYRAYTSTVDQKSGDAVYNEAR